MIIFCDNSNIIKGLSKANSPRSIRSHDSSASSSDNSTYNLASSSYQLNRSTNSLPTSLLATLSYNHLIKFNNSKLDEEMSQIKNHLKILSTMSTFVSKVPLFKEESETTIFSYHDKPPLNINILFATSIREIKDS